MVLMDTYYTRIGLSPNASEKEIEEAYHLQQERYNPDRVASMDEEIQQVARQRIEEMQQAYAILSDPQQRHAYDQRIGIVYDESHSSSTQPPHLPKARERWFAVGGILVGLLLVAVIWMVTGSTDAKVPDAPEVHRPAPDFALLTPDGKTIQLSNYRGKIVLVNFWGTWCEPCIREIPSLQSAYEQLGDQGFVVIGINLFDNEQAQHRTEEDIRTFIEQNTITYPVVLDTEGKVTDAYRVFPIPTSFIVDAQGSIRYVLPREVTSEEITAWFTKLKRET
jgi:cytochrome c biogenesis protein CcmG, thiol:disulfide interchange protein DsbE